MASPVALVNRIIALLQTVTDFFVTPLAFNNAEATNLVAALEALRGSLQALPLDGLKKAELLGRLDQAQVILADFIAGTSPLSTVEVLLAVAGELEVLKQKILALRLKPCASAVTVCLPGPFSTAWVCH
ncbi:MAG: hypothetical protein ACUVRM_11045 [Bacillota bacterium]